MNELLKEKEVQAVKIKGFKLPLERHQYLDLIAKLESIIQDLINNGKLDNCKMEDNGTRLIEEITSDYNGEVVGLHDFHMIGDFDFLTQNKEIDQTIHNFICDLLEKENKELLEDNSLSLSFDDWMDFAVHAQLYIEGIEISELNLNLDRLVAKQ